MKSSLAVGPKISDRRHQQRKQWRQQLLQVVADKKILLARLADDSGRIDRVTPVKDRVDVKNRIVVLQGVVTVMIAKWTFRPPLVRERIPNQNEFSLCGEPVLFRAERIAPHLEFV